jgi:VanZ family protein
MTALRDRLWKPLTAITLTAIACASLSPLPELPLPSLLLWDKIQHVVAYAVLALPVALAAPRRWPLWIVGFLMISAGIELIQPMLNRYGEWKDLVANSAGLVAGSATGIALRLTLLPRRS